MFGFRYRKLGKGYNVVFPSKMRAIHWTFVGFFRFTYYGKSFYFRFFASPFELRAGRETRSAEELIRRHTDTLTYVVPPQV